MGISNAVDVPGSGSTGLRSSRIVVYSVFKALAVLTLVELACVLPLAYLKPVPFHFSLLVVFSICHFAPSECQLSYLVLPPEGLLFWLPKFTPPSIDITVKKELCG